MSETVIHSIPGSPFGRAVLAALEEKGARYRLVAVALGAPEWLALTADRNNLQYWLAAMNARPSMAATAWQRVSAMAQAA